MSEHHAALPAEWGRYAALPADEWLRARGRTLRPCKRCGRRWIAPVGDRDKRWTLCPPGEGCMTRNVPDPWQATAP